ncbi:MAG: N-acetylmuramoyl-L-alanine amidase [Defluviitaleaceae bacterium]|nr:N-acetylmuramoyl-L-alanine amidase [Defluviitaleaceae bacterium]MCL2835172.1 N-acetylmuramoyl-L-alanine amidase [Defluviitaleaceae bacterium]
MEINIKDALLTPGAERGRGGARLDPQGVVIHFVGNAGSSAMANRNYFENGSAGNRVSAHYIVGLQGEILRCVPENERAAHAGRSFGASWNEMARTNNSRLLGIETCHPKPDGRFSSVTYRALIGLTADICIRHNLDPFSQVFRHYCVTGKSCPLFYVNNEAEWNRMRNAIFAGVLVTKCHRLGFQYDPAYWERVMSGEILAEYDYLRILEERLA